MIPKTPWIFRRINYWNARARLGFRVLAITLHDAVFDRKEVFADAAAMGILLIPAVEVRLLGCRRDCVECHRGRDRAGEKFR